MLFTIGTGLGMALVVNNGKKSIVLPSESWGVQFSPDYSNELLAKAGDYCKYKMKKKGSLGKFCTGGGLLKLFEFMKATYPELDKGYEHIIKKKLKTEIKTQKLAKRPIQVQECVTYAAIHEEDELCIKTIDLLIEIIGYICQRLAVTTMCMGGIYLGGGVINILSEYIAKKQELFWKEFLNHDVMRDHLLKIPVFVMKKPLTLDGMQQMVY